MLDIAGFLSLLAAAISRFQHRPLNDRQRACVESSPRTPLMIVAGPGSGKTTVLVLRALRLVFVDGLMPEEIVLTTFTRKAAAELRSRLIEWGHLVQEHLKKHPAKRKEPVCPDWIEAVDVHRFVTGTLDSLCEELLRTQRDPTDAVPVLVEGFVGDALLARHGLFPTGAHNNQDLFAYLAAFTREGGTPANFGEALQVCRTVVDRLINDQVDIDAFTCGRPGKRGRECVAQSLATYRAYMAETNRMDFAGLEELFLARMREGHLGRFTSSVKAVLVDEYQDTNPLQESIYFELARQSRPSLTVVGDDDQSLFRFRGATVELFRDFRDRFRTALPAASRPRLLHLVDNYRSTPEIVSFFNAFITCDPAFASARVQPPKPATVARTKSIGLPVLGMFRDNVQTLAADLAGFLDDIFRGPGRAIPIEGKSHRVLCDANGGDLGDAVFLAYSVNEFASAWGGNQPRPRLPRLLRDELEQRNMAAFNPRGRALRDIPEVQALLGVMLECTDPDGAQERAAPLRGGARQYLQTWRQVGRAFVASDPAPRRPQTLSSFVDAWQSRTSQTEQRWPSEWPVLELCYKVVTWLPSFYDDPEGQVYWEAISRGIAQAATFSPYRSTILHGQGVHDDRSVQQAIIDVMAPLAENAVEVDEDIMPHIPRGRLPIMTVHQAKGLEFPLVIVDVSSDFATNHRTQRFKRFPEGPSSVQRMEDDLAPYCEIGDLRLQRPGTLRAFDDLIRLYYVAYSRPQSLLLLVGMRATLRYSTLIQNVAMGWRSDGSWSWAKPVSGRPPALANNVPLELI